jgi:TetR/AcrR family transcriptional repressor of nem operon
MQAEVVRFFDENQKWLAKLLEEGKADGTLTFRGQPEEVAQGILSTLEGAMLVARPYGDLARFDAATKQLVNGLTP